MQQQADTSLPLGPTAAASGLSRCPVCAWVTDAAHDQCERCGQRLHPSGQSHPRRTWALLIASLILYLPANLLPILEVSRLGRGEPKTIIGGIIELIDVGMYPIAFVVFVASVVVPLLKMLGLMMLLLAMQKNWSLCPVQRSTLYRWITLVGRWSMLDVFVIALLAALVQLGSVVQIQAGIAASAFAAVVVLTMIAAHQFDPRRMWQVWEANQARP